MRIVPIVSSFKKGVSNNSNKMTKFESKNLKKDCQTRKYTGNASVDLAYASMIDEKIAQDLKLMGLI